LKQVSILLALAGLMLGTGVVGWFGFDRVGAATVSVGWRGFALLAACQVGLFGILGLAWRAIMPHRMATLRAITWGRMVRDAAANCLPFAMMGGIAAGARAVVPHGLGWPQAVGSSIVDVTAEFLGQIAFVAVGLIVLLVRAPGSELTLPLAIGLAAAVASGAAFVWLQLGAGRLFRALGGRIAGGRLAGATEHVERLHVELASLYSRSGRLAIGALLHLLGWFGTGIVAWIAYRLLGADIDLGAVLAIEALLQVLLTAAFLVPGSIGVQEAGYASIGAAFGLPPEISLGVSLLRRARDLALGIPILLIWQFAEARRAIGGPLAWPVPAKQPGRRGVERAR
jgi:glycosyltransferase 2 family protein